MPPRTVLYMTPSVRMLGARQSLLTLVAHLDRDRYRPLVCCQTPGALTEALDRAGVEWVCVKTGWWRKARYWPRIPFALWRLVRLVRRRGIDLIHCNEIYPNPYACLVRRWTGAPVATHMRLTVTPDMARKYWLHDADRIIVVSEAAGRDFDFWPDKDRRVRVVYNPIDASAYAVDEPREITRRRLGWTPDAFVVALVGTWTPRKRQHVAIEAVGMLAERLPNLRLVLVGGAASSQRKYESGLKALLGEWDLDDRVLMLPFTDDIAPIYHAIDLNLLISGEEGFGRTVLEAGAAGRPSIGTRIGGIPELIRDGQSGWLISPDDPTALAERIAWVVANPSALEQAGREARLLALERFLVEDHVKKVEAIYDEVLAESSTRRSRFCQE